MPPKKRTTTTTATTTPMTDAQLKALITQGVSDALAEIKANRTSRNGDDSHDSRTGSRRTKRVACACNYSDFLKCQPLNFKELALMCDRMFLKDLDEIEKYVGGLLDMIHRSVMLSKPKTMQDAIKFATELTDLKIRTLAKRPGEKRPHGESKPLCPKCNYHHDGQCAPKCTNCKRTGHSAQDCRSQLAANNNQRAQGNNCPKLMNKNKGNQAGNDNAVARAYDVGTARTNLNSNVVMGTFLLNNRYASILFDTGADMSFVAFSSLIDIVPTIIDYGYDVELANGKIITVNTLIWGCTLNFLNHPFNIDLMPVELGSFDIIIGMEWLSWYHAVIDCAEKIVCIPFGNEILIFGGDGSNDRHESQLNIISCTKTQKYFLKGCHVFLAHVTTKKVEDNSEEKRLEDVPIV
nr:hypothetical protein [Tanacetum cinerariifolium]